MRLEIRHDGAPLDERAREHIGRRLDFALDRFSERIDRITVFVTDQNGPRGGPDQRCRLVVHVPGARPVVVDATEPALTSAIDRAAHRASHALVSRIDRRRSRRPTFAPGGGPPQPER